MEERDKGTLVKKLFFSIIIFILFTFITFKGFLKFIDLGIGGILIGLSNNNFLYNLFYFIRKLGDFEFSLFYLAGISILSFKINLRKLAFFIVTFFFILMIAGYSLKTYTNRQRPVKEFYEESYTEELPNLNRKAYPSGHTFRITFLLLILSSIFTKMRIKNWLKNVLKGILYLLIFLMALSSVCLGTHWISDCLAGFILGYSFYVLLFLFAPYSPLASVKP